MSSRRRFLRASAATALGFLGLRMSAHGAPQEEPPKKEAGYGPLLTDPMGMLDLPQGFSYSVISTAGHPMDDGFVVPGAPDGMAAFPGPFGMTTLIRNHELSPNNPGPFGEKREHYRDLGDKIYDPGGGTTPSSGGTTTLVYDTKRKQVVREFLSLAGTIRNCAGGPTPWKSWVSCEETTVKIGKHGKDDGAYETERHHGYNFEVPVTTKIALADPRPLKAMGRFNHEAIAVDEKSGAVYETEDRDDGLFYRFLPDQAGQLHAGRLQALVIAGAKSLDTRNWNRQECYRGEKLPVEWIDMDKVESPDDDLRKRGFDAGAAKFARGEGIWYADDGIYFACTSGGKAHKGQIWRYHPSDKEGQSGEQGYVELFIEPNDGALIENADNLTVSPWGDLVVCEDRSGQVVRLVGVTPKGECYTLAFSHMRTEFAGATFSPDGSTLFVNSQGNGLTIAITGPWKTNAPA